MSSINKRITQVLESSQDADVLDLCQQFDSVDVYTFLDNLIEVVNRHNPDLKRGLFLTQAESVSEQLSLSMENDNALSTLCQKLSSIQTAGFVSRYMQVTDSHRHFANEADVVMFGDSITEWGPWSEMFPSAQLVNRGLAGDTTKGMLRRIETTLQVKPNRVFVMAGINDLAQGFRVEDIFNRYLEMLDIWQQNNIEVVVQSTLFVGPRLASLNSMVFELNTLLKKVSKERGIQYVDVAEVLCPDQTLPLKYSCDDLHLNAAAYQKWQDTIGALLA